MLTKESKNHIELFAKESINSIKRIAKNDELLALALQFVINELPQNLSFARFNEIKALLSEAEGPGLDYALLTPTSIHKDISNSEQEEAKAYLRALIKAVINNPAAEFNQIILIANSSQNASSSVAASSNRVTPSSSMVANHPNNLFYNSLHVTNLYDRSTYTYKNVPKNSSFADLKLLIKNRIGIPTEAQRLIFSGNQFADEATLASSNVKDDSSIQFIFSLRGD